MKEEHVSTAQVMFMPIPMATAWEVCLALISEYGSYCSTHFRMPEKMSWRP